LAAPLRGVLGEARVVGAGEAELARVLVGVGAAADVVVVHGVALVVGEGGLGALHAVARHLGDPTAVMARAVCVAARGG
jgi:hypothetical protein